MPLLKDRFAMEEAGVIVRNGKQTVVATVGVGEFRSSVPYIVKADDIVLEIGCQQGHTCRVIADHLKALQKSGDGSVACTRGSCQVIGVDISKESIARAKSRHTTFIEANEMFYDVHDGFDADGLAEKFPNVTVIYVDISGLSSR